MLIGNPAQPALQKEGIWSSKSNCSLRLAFLEDYVYCQRFKDEFLDAELSHSKTYSKLNTNAALVTLNFRNWIDLYAILGSAQIQLDREVFTQRQFAWGTGLKVSLYHQKKFRIGADLKYFETDQKPLYFISEGLPFNVRSHFTLQYHEIQAALGMSYRTGPLIPYVYATYLFSQIEPHPPAVTVLIPTMNLEADMYMKSVINQRRLGMCVGATLLDCRKATFTVESRFFNQNSIDVNFEIRF